MFIIFITFHSLSASGDVLLKLSVSLIPWCTESRQFLLYARQIEIRGVDIENPYYNYIISFTVPVIDNVTALDYDAQEQRIYWSDVRTQMIKRAFINGTGVETVVSAGMTPASDHFCVFFNHDLHRLAELQGIEVTSVAVFRYT